MTEFKEAEVMRLEKIKIQLQARATMDKEVELQHGAPKEL